MVARGRLRLVHRAGARRPGIVLLALRWRCRRTGDVPRNAPGIPSTTSSTRARPRTTTTTRTATMTQPEWSNGTRPASPSTTSYVGRRRPTLPARAVHTLSTRAAGQRSRCRRRGTAWCRRPAREHERHRGAERAWTGAGAASTLPPPTTSRRFRIAASAGRHSVRTGPSWGPDDDDVPLAPVGPVGPVPERRRAGPA